MISYARAFNGISNGDLDAKGGMIFTTDCTQAVSASPGPTPAPATYKYIKITSFDNGTTVFGCNGQNDNPPYTIASNTASLINTSSIAVDYNSCYFTCSQSGYGLPTTIGIYFTLSQLNSNGLAEKSSTIPFEASVTMRNVAY
jgi:hypothetical protein